MEFCSIRNFNEYADEMIKQIIANNLKMLGNRNKSIKGTKSYKNFLTGVYAPNEASRKNIPAAIIMVSFLSFFLKKPNRNALKQKVPKLKFDMEMSLSIKTRSVAVTSERRHEINDCGENGN